MCQHDCDGNHASAGHARCCPAVSPEMLAAMSRRTFLGGLGTAAAGSMALAGLSWSALVAAEPEVATAPPRRPLAVKPVLVYSTPRRQPQTSWRSWGGIQTQQDAEAEVGRIKGELDQLKTKADFPVNFLPIAAVRGRHDLAGISDLAAADAIIIYAAGGSSDVFDELGKLGKDVLFFCRHKSGPVYLWYEIVSPRYIRGHTDTAVRKDITDADVVIDNQDEILWRLRSLCGLRNTVGSRILAIGGAAGWETPKAPQLAKERFKLDIQAVGYPELGELIKAARADQATVDLARRRADEYLKQPGVTLETRRQFVDNCFLLDDVFRRLMRKFECRAMTINACMGTIMPIAETSACMTLSLLNDDRYLAFCESDFVVVPSGMLLGNISGRPQFLNDPTYPHDGVITLAHCTGPRRMDGKTLEPVRLVTHFESDYGAAPKVEMRKGQITTNIMPDFKAERWVGLTGEIVDVPFLDICRDQIDIRFKCDSRLVAERMPGFHWMTCYGDYTKELGYALRRVGIQWECLG